GVQIDRVEIKDVSLPETMKRSMARQAEADRERRARIINADAELQASKKLAQAAEVMSEQPAALQLRLLQTVVAVAAEKNSTLVLPFPVELLRFLERAQSGQPPVVAESQRAPRSEVPPVVEPVETPAAPDRVNGVPEALGLPEAFADTDGLGVPDAFGLLRAPGTPKEPGEPDGSGNSDGSGEVEGSGRAPEAPAG
ncbi:SPFH domain-containing protein, partial [Streptomyces sp. NPDC005251]|uniref:SPFH domain-containing protein n=1 Tax=Streptomyces sp. NPDC005251 TaxID=3157166 RepID=UPI0033B19520